MTQRPGPFAAALAAGAAAWAMAAPGWTAPQAIPAELRVPQPPQAVRAEGRSRLLYELHVTNLGRQPLTLREVEVLGAGDRVLARSAGAALADAMLRPGVRTDAPLRLEPGLRAVVFLEVDMAGEAALPRGLLHRLTFDPITPPNAVEQSVLVGAPTTPLAPPAPLGPPLRGSGWVASHGLSNASSHRRTLLTLGGRPVIAQRFAIDFIRIGPDGQAFRGDPADNAHWGSYAADVLAVADGTVERVRDGIPENDPTSDTRAVPITLDTVGGDCIVLRLRDGRFVFYAHLQPGSIRVKPGQSVREGAVLARLGNSGQSDAPHLHVQVMDGPGPLEAEGRPLTFRRFTLIGHLPSLKVLADGTGWRAAGPPQIRTDEAPVENAVIAFP